MKAITSFADKDVAARTRLRDAGACEGSFSHSILYSFDHLLETSVNKSNVFLYVLILQRWWRHCVCMVPQAPQYL
jgi:hypothetical protein